MTILKKVLIFLAGVAVSGVIAFIGAVYMGDNGMLGSCFEGACGYAAIFVAFPLLWLGLTAAFVGGWILISFLSN